MSVNPWTEWLEERKATHRTAFGPRPQSFATAGNWTAGGGAATTLADSNLLIPESANQTFTYNGWDPISLPSSTLMVDGKATFPEVGGIYFAGKKID